MNHLSFYPEKVSQHLQLNEPGLSEVFLDTADGIKIHALSVEATSSKKIILFFHGNAGHAYHRLPDAYALNQAGTNVLLVEYRGYGKSEGKPSEQGIYKDAEAAYEYLINVKKYAPENIYFLGRSIGSAAALHLAKDNKHGGLILLTPISSGEDMAKEMGLSWLSWAIGPVFNNLEKIKTVKTPTMVIHGDTDNIVPFALGEKIYNASPSEKKQFVRIKGAGHNNLNEIAGPELWQTVGQFIQDSSQP